MKLPLTDDFRSIVLQERPMIDVRAPVEYEKGAFPGAVNLPLLNDAERRLVGIRYKESGNDAAVELGNVLIKGAVKSERVFAWNTFAQMHPEAYLYCFRGGQRSKISQTWLAEAGKTIPRIKGGYKAFRNFLISESERISSDVNTLIIGGRTGSGKTLLIRELDNAIDLEGIANHRGSSFGRFVTPQPSQIDFENRLGYALIRHEAAGHRHLVIEHESHNIGRIYIPKGIFDNLQKAKLVILETSLEERIRITFEEYIKAALVNYRNAFSAEGEKRWFDDLNSSLDRIRKRLGSERYLCIKRLLADGYAEQLKNGDIDGHRLWIRILLSEYYDPMYDYQIKKSPIPIIFHGVAEEVSAFIRSCENGL